MNNNLKVKIKISANYKIFFVNIDKKNFLLIKFSDLNLKYILIPPFISLQKEKKHINLILNSNYLASVLLFNNFVSFFSSWIKRFDNFFRKKLVLKGLGFKIIFVDSSNVLQLKLGYSHLIDVAIPSKDLTVYTDKNVLVVEGFDKVKVGCFIDKIRNLKFPDSYKGKGFWYKNENLTLKEVKKT